MSFLKQLLNPFIEFEDQKKNEAKISTPSVSSAGQKEENVSHPLITEKEIQTEGHAPQATTSSQAIPAGPLSEHVQYFEQLIEKANNQNPLFSGPDFKEFLDTKINIDDITDETLKYTTAFNILKKSGLTKERLFATAHEYQNIIGRDLNAFQTAHNQQYKNELQQKELNLQKKAEELHALTLRLNALKSEINTATQEINQKKEKLNSIKKSFLTAGENKQKEIQTELDKISKYFD